MSFSTWSWILHSIPTHITFTNILVTTVGILSISSWLTKRLMDNNNNKNNNNNKKDNDDNNDVGNDVVNSKGTKITCYHVGESLPYTTISNNNDNKCIYLDYNATTPIFPEVYQSMIPFLTYNFGNPSSSHSYAIPSKLALQNARYVQYNLLVYIVSCNCCIVIISSSSLSSDYHLHLTIVIIIISLSS